MTTPNQPLPASAAGAFVIGGGDNNFGQDVTEDAVRALFMPPVPTLAGALTEIEQQLLKLPIEALQMFAGFVPGLDLATDFPDVPTAVASILGLLDDKKLPLLLDDFQDFLNTIVGVGSGATADDVLAKFTDILSDLGLKLDLTSWQSLLDGVKGAGGGAIVDLINKLTHLDSSGQFDASKLFNLSGIGAIAQSSITGLTTALSGLLSGSTWQTFLDSIKGSGGGSITDVVNKLFHLNSSGVIDVTGVPALPASKVTTGTFSDSFLPSVPAIRDGLSTALSGLTISGVSLTDLVSRFTNLVATTQDTAAALSDIQSQLNGSNFSGVSGSDDLERTSTTDLGGTGFFTQVYTGAATNTKLVANGHEADISPDLSNDASVQCYARCTNPLFTNTATTYQEASIILGSRLDDTNGIVTGVCSNRIYLRCNAAGTQYVFAEIERSQVSIWYKNGGSETQLGSTQAILSKGSPGSRWRFKAGTGGGQYTFMVFLGIQPILTVNDVSHVTALNTGWGIGVSTAADVFSNQVVRPATIAMATIADTSAAAVVGSTFRAYRATTSGVSNATGDHSLPSGTLDTIDYISPDFSWDSSTQKLTLSSTAPPGTYLMSSRFEFSSTLGGGGSAWITKWSKNSAIFAMSDREDETLFGSSTNIAVGGQAVMTYLQPGDTLQPSVNVGAARSIIGDAGGQKTWVSVARIGG